MAVGLIRALQLNDPGPFFGLIQLSELSGAAQPDPIFGPIFGLCFKVSEKVGVAQPDPIFTSIK